MAQPTSSPCAAVITTRVSCVRSDTTQASHGFVRGQSPLNARHPTGATRERHVDTRRDVCARVLGGAERTSAMATVRTVLIVSAGPTAAPRTRSWGTRLLAPQDRLSRFVHRSSRARLCRRYCSCLKATAMVLDLHPIGSSRAPSLCLCTGRNASGQVALPWVVAKRAPRRHRLRTPAFMRERGAECRKRIPIRTDRLR
jgi:hypothetical protein